MTEWGGSSQLSIQRWDPAYVEGAGLLGLGGIPEEKQVGL